MNTPSNGRRYDRRLTDPLLWPSTRFGRRAEEETRRRVNELSWELAGLQVAEEIEAVLSGRAPMPGPARQRRRGDPGE